MAACPLCILGYSAEDHTKENWESIESDPEKKAIVLAHWKAHPGVIAPEEWKRVLETASDTEE